MQKWKVQIPKPNAKRLKFGKVIVSLDNGWSGVGERVIQFRMGEDIVNLGEYPIEPNVTQLEFEVADSFEYIHNTTCKDGATFDVRIEYSNETGTRKQIVKLVPSKCN